MKLIVAIIISLMCLFFLAEEVQCARILAVIPTPSYSHNRAFKPLWMELNKRGHDIVLVTTNPIPNMNTTSFVQIDISKSYGIVDRYNFVQRRFSKVNWLTLQKTDIFGLGDNFAHEIYNNSEVRKLYAPDSDAKFDVVMIQAFISPAVFALAHRFNAPLIGVVSCGILAVHEHILGGLVLPSHESTWEMEGIEGPNLSFWQRLQNFLNMWNYVFDSYNILIANQQKIMNQYLGNDLPSLLDIEKNMSLVFINQIDAITPAKPRLANMITYTLTYPETNLNQLPEDLERFLDDASEGFIYFSLGSMILSFQLPPETIQVLLDVLGRLPYKVVWKYEKQLPRKLDNIFTAPWFHQPSILAHRKIKLFMYQGGLQSTQEAMHFGVPVLGFPVFSDQMYQAKRMEALGLGKRMDLTTLNRNDLEAAIREIITNRRYKEKMIEIKNTIEDVPYNSMEHLAWWTEYVIRHKGVPHLHSSLTRQPWYQRNDMDIIVFLTTVVCILITIAIGTIVTLVRFCRRRRSSAENHKLKVS
ncbi:UDP-glycosyltransferase UGT5-like [Hylaeus anthracinus]|uniref:UDP-glycosyltransferase UGT5-like n=1 Tax=Hylaeus anthracinus TaxID=313031 RepID=UPI0023B990E8|nr:UDP-glycosyltransferase UGT5-like [Hylaeus anthracinus]